MANGDSDELPAASAPARSGAKETDGKQLHIARLRRQVDMQERRLTILNRKLLTLHETLVRVSGSAITVPTDDPVAAAHPLERRLSPGSTQTVISFAGLALVPGMPPREFWRSLSGFDVNVLLAKDFKQCWYQQGLLGLAGTVAETTELLRRAVPEGQTTTATLGSSAGGYAAILFGVLMGVDKIVAFGPQTLLNSRVFAKFENAQSVFADLVREGRDYLDLVEVIKANPGFAGKIRIYYSQSNEVDREAAERLAVFDFVEVLPHPGEAHGVAREMARGPEFKEALEWLFS